MPVRLRENQYPKGHPFRESTNARIRRLRRKDVLAARPVLELTEKSNISRVNDLPHLSFAGSPTEQLFVVGSDARKDHSWQKQIC